MLRGLARILLALLLVLALTLPIVSWFLTIQSNCHGLAIRLQNGYALVAWGRGVGHIWGLNVNYTAPDAHLAEFLCLPQFISNLSPPAPHILRLPFWLLDGLLLTSATTLLWLTHYKPTPHRAFPLDDPSPEGLTAQSPSESPPTV